MLSSWKIAKTYQIARERAFFQGALLAAITAYYGVILQKSHLSSNNFARKLDYSFNEISQEKISVTFNKNITLPKDLATLTQSRS